MAVMVKTGSAETGDAKQSRKSAETTEKLCFIKVPGESERTEFNSETSRTLKVAWHGDETPEYPTDLVFLQYTTYSVAVQPILPVHDFHPVIGSQPGLSSPVSSCISALSWNPPAVPNI
jgi:hypothetical protein